MSYPIISRKWLAYPSQSVIVRAGYARVNGCFGNGTGDTSQESRVERFRQDVIASESRPFQFVGSIYDVGNRFFGKSGDCVNGC